MNSSIRLLLVASCLLGLPAIAAASAFFVGVGSLPGGQHSSDAFDTSGDGSVVIGTSSSTEGTQAYRWTASDGIVGLGFLSGPSSVGRGASGDGSVLAGYSHGPSGTEAVVWTEQGIRGLGDLPGGEYFSAAWGI